MLRKDPLTNKRLIAFTWMLLLLSAASIYAFFKLQALPTKNLLDPLNGLWPILLPLTAMIFSCFWFVIATWKSIESRLERFSGAVDRIIEGDFSLSLDNSEEGIISRLEGQIAAMSRRLQLTLDHVELEKEKQQALVSDISHQIKTPLASIKLYNSLIAAGGLSPIEQIEFLGRIEEQILRLEWLSASLTKISRLEAGMITLRMEPADIKVTIVDAVNAVCLKALGEKVEIHLQHLNPVIMNHDVKWTREALVNILENAIKYTAESGTVTISMEQLETYIKINITDTGIGIPPHEINRVFDRFFRGESEKVRNIEGSGIGLYLARKIIEEQGGGINLISNIDRGSCFSLLFLR